jgi:hypothetical protein
MYWKRDGVERYPLPLVKRLTLTFYLNEFLVRPLQSRSIGVDAPAQIGGAWRIKMLLYKQPVPQATTA